MNASNLDLEQMQAHAEQAAQLLKSLAHPARLRVLCQLVEGEASVSELQAKSGLSMSALSQHLAVLRDAELVTTRREAQSIYYALADSPALGVMHALHEAYCGKEKDKRRRIA
ncbi:metalloregulator ArsR/SmtB family transcription factor [Stenotrophomonas sp. SY1]|jgi:DNA-binding transcriptional ArsR family regulator|uniref:ArsR/SmtB family transcription factor n=1 Tax=Stenotrophomonas sp. SY1 TaxID=477235 RepID=UPI001E4DE016|nr:metalloregulator ArsR/SmtB family transcription factor [Stenotrophomonas sp. SY1]MCD9087781.1 metalloregulator ArsR/SmtB family transcription factor [Stenotrophomonas sp. SY1]